MRYIIYRQRWPLTYFNELSSTGRRIKRLFAQMEAGHSITLRYISAVYGGPRFTVARDSRRESSIRGWNSNEILSPFTKGENYASNCSENGRL